MWYDATSRDLDNLNWLNCLLAFIFPFFILDSYLVLNKWGREFRWKGAHLPIRIHKIQVSNVADRQIRVMADAPQTSMDAVVHSYTIHTNSYWHVSIDVLTNFNFLINHIFLKLLFTCTPFAHFLDDTYYGTFPSQPTWYMATSPSIEKR